jgi:hypothetical protein
MRILTDGEKNRDQQVLKEMEKKMQRQLIFETTKK